METLKYPLDLKTLDMLTLKAINNEIITIRGINKFGQKFEVKSKIFAERSYSTNLIKPKLGDNYIEINFKSENESVLSLCHFQYKSIDELSIIEVLDDKGKKIYECPIIDKIFANANEFMKTKKFDKNLIYFEKYYNINKEEQSNIDVFEQNIGKPIKITKDGKSKKVIAVANKGKMLYIIDKRFSIGKDFVTGAKIEPAYEETKSKQNEIEREQV